MGKPFRQQIAPLTAVKKQELEDVIRSGNSDVGKGDKYRSVPFPLMTTDAAYTRGPLVVITKTYLSEAGHRVDARLTREKILAALIWALLAASWMVTLITISSTWTQMSTTALSTSIIMSVAFCIALWRVLKNRQTFLLAISLAGMASFLGSYLIMFLITGISL